MTTFSVLIAYCVSFLAAFLLFVIQPVVSKTILPILGGTPAVWNACMVSFQLLLLAGYLYAHGLSKIRSLRLQVGIHTLLFIACLLAWQLSADTLRADPVTGDPLWWVVSRLISTAGLPFFFIAATAPLLQRWVSLGRSPLAESPYRLYSASNAGSLTALLGFILFIEPGFTLPELFGNWSVLFLLAASLLIALGISTSIAPRNITIADHAPAAPASRAAILKWIWLALIPSSLMLGVTTYITTDIAAIPLLWLAPLSLYLLSFIAAFSERMAGTRTARACIILCSVALITYAMNMHSLTLIYLLHLLSFAIACFALHGMLATHKPKAEHLTLYYLCISLGGFLGGTFNTLIAPQLFSGIAEYPLMLTAAVLTVLFVSKDAPALQRPAQRLSLVFIIAAWAILLQYYLITSKVSVAPVLSATVIGIGLCFFAIVVVKQKDFRHIMYLMTVLLPIALYNHHQNTADAYGVTRFKERNFYGSLYVKEKAKEEFRFLQYNTTIHGGQHTDPARKLEMTAYYPYAMKAAQRFLPVNQPHNNAVIGLGTGVMQCANAPEDHVDFYEINPAVARIAENQKFFTFLSECPGSYDIIMGDGRLEIAKAADASYDMIIVDAFSSDAIPFHLLTKEAIETYRQKLKPGGLLVTHISNRHMNLRPLLSLQIRSAGGIGFVREFDVSKKEKQVFSSTWFIAKFDNDQNFTSTAFADDWWPVEPLADTRVWTDDYSNIIPYMKFLD